MAGRPRLPDFIIGGAMKSGTTSIHRLLGSHPDVFIPDRELFFFDCDDVEQHPQLLRKGFVLPDYAEELRMRLDRYGSWFDGAGDDQLIGEDTTTYLASDKAPGRIADLLPDVKLIFVLRDPVDRAYSHYWHLVRHGLAFFDFDTTLEHMPGTIVQRGLYKRQLERYLRWFRREQMHVVLLDELQASPHRVLDDLGGFLGLRPGEGEPAGGADRHNVGAALRHPRLYRGASLVLGATLARSRAAQTPAEPPAARPEGGDGGAWSVVRDTVLLDRGSSYPPMAPDTRRRLSDFYARENFGLAELLERDPATLWPVGAR